MSHPASPHLSLPLDAPQAYLEQVRASPDCWRLCLARFQDSQYLEVRFWCAQTLSSLARSSSYAQLPPEARDQLKRALVAAGSQPAAAQLPSFLRNKIAQAVVAIAAHEYPDQWPSFFQASRGGSCGWAAVAADGPTGLPSAGWAELPLRNATHTVLLTAASLLAVLPRPTAPPPPSC